VGAYGDPTACGGAAAAPVAAGGVLRSSGGALETDRQRVREDVGSIGACGGLWGLCLTPRKAQA